MIDDNSSMSSQGLTPTDVLNIKNFRIATWNVGTLRGRSGGDVDKETC